MNAKKFQTRRHIGDFVVIGDSNVGKSSLIRQFLRKSFLQQYIPTVGVDISEVVYHNDGENINFRVWDSCGQERFVNRLCETHVGCLKRAQGVILVFDVTCKRSLQNIAMWHGIIKKCCDSDVPVILVGNKNEVGEPAVEPEEVEDIVKQFCFYGPVYCSAKTGKNVQYVFNSMMQFLYLRMKEREEYEDEITVIDYSEPKTFSSSSPNSWYSKLYREITLRTRSYSL